METWWAVVGRQQIYCNHYWTINCGRSRLLYCDYRRTATQNSCFPLYVVSRYKVFQKYWNIDSCKIIPGGRFSTTSSNSKELTSRPQAAASSRQLVTEKLWAEDNNRLSTTFESVQRCHHTPQRSYLLPVVGVGLRPWGWFGNKPTDGSLSGTRFMWSD